VTTERSCSLLRGRHSSRPHGVDNKSCGDISSSVDHFRFCGGLCALDARRASLPDARTCTALEHSRSTFSSARFDHLDWESPSRPVLRRVRPRPVAAGSASTACAFRVGVAPPRVTPWRSHTFCRLTASGPDLDTKSAPSGAKASSRARLARRRRLRAVRSTRGRRSRPSGDDELSFDRA